MRLSLIQVHFSQSTDFNNSPIQKPHDQGVDLTGHCPLIACMRQTCPLNILGLGQNFRGECSKIRRRRRCFLRFSAKFETHLFYILKNCNFNSNSHNLAKFETCIYDYIWCKNFVYQRQFPL